MRRERLETVDLAKLLDPGARKSTTVRLAIAIAVVVDAAAFALLLWKFLG